MFSGPLETFFVYGPGLGIYKTKIHRRTLGTKIQNLVQGHYRYENQTPDTRLVLSVCVNVLYVLMEKNSVRDQNTRSIP